MPGLLAAFRAGRGRALAVGKRAAVSGDSREFIITEWRGEQFELSCLCGDKQKIIMRQACEVRILPGCSRMR